MTQAPPANRFSQEASQSEKARILKEQARVIAEQSERSAGTRAAYNNIIDPLPSGRWSKPSRGNDPSQLYPRIPSGPWSGSGPQMPPEEPLGFSVEDMMPCGTPSEVQRSLSALSPPPVVSSGQDAAPADGIASSPSANLASPSPHADVSVRKNDTSRVERAGEGEVLSSSGADDVTAFPSIAPAGAPRGLNSPRGAPDFFIRRKFI
jgi:hypothetical protein